MTTVYNSKRSINDDLLATSSARLNQLQLQLSQSNDTMSTCCSVD